MCCINNVQMWKYAILTGNFHVTRTCSFHFPVKICKNNNIEKLKAWSSRLWVNYFCKLNIERARALQISTTLIFYTNCIICKCLIILNNEYGVIFLEPLIVLITI